MNICKLSIYLTLVLISTSCIGTQSTFSSSEQKKIYRKQQFYISQFGKIVDQSPQVLKDRNLVRIYEKGILHAIGHERQKYRKGIWYFFDDTLGLKYLVNYKRNEIDTIINPYSIINQRW